MPADVHIVLNTCPDMDTAQHIAGSLVEEKLAACVNIIDGIHSVYQWKGKVHTDGEVLLLIKSPVARFSALQDRLRELHPYELPEIVAVPITDGLPEYLTWASEPGR